MDASMDTSTPLIGKIYHWLIGRCEVPTPLPSPWHRLADGPHVIGPIRDRAAALAIFEQCARADLVRSGVATFGEDGTPSLAAELFAENFFGIALQDATGNPPAILTATGSLAPNGPPGIATVLADPWIQGHLRQHGVLLMVADILEVRILRALGIPAVPVAVLERDNWIWPLEGEELEPDPRYVLYEEQLVADALAQEAADLARVHVDATGKRDDEERDNGVEPARAAPAPTPSAPDPCADARPGPDDQSKATATGDMNTGPPAQRPIIVLAGGSLATLTPSIPPAVAAAAGSIVRMRNLGGLDLDWIRAWQPDTDLFERLRFFLEHDQQERARQLVGRSLQALLPIDDLVEPGPVAEPDYRTVRDDYIDALNSTSPPAL